MVIDADTLSYLSFDSSLTTDPIGNTWIAYGSMSLSTNSVSGKSASFPGTTDSYIYSSNPLISGSSDFTISLDFYDTSGSSQFPTFFATRSGGNNGLTVGAHPERTISIAAGNNGWFFETTSTATYQKNIWNNLVARRNGSVFTVELNNTVIITVNSSAVIASQLFSLGSDRGNTASSLMPFVGQIDNVFVSKNGKASMSSTVQCMTGGM